MRRSILFVLLLASGFLAGQTNLVPNPSFEVIDNCPDNQDQLYLAAPWFKPTPNSSDLFNACGAVTSCIAPQNLTGYQQPRTGNGYAGIGVYAYTYNGVDNRREYLSVKLLDTLRAGKTYCVEFYASLADSSYWHINRLGLYLSSHAIIDNLTIDTLTAVPQIEHDPAVIITDTQNWLRIHGTYVANGTEQFITIGNFYADDQTDTVAQGNPLMGAYFYIDDVGVYELADVQAGDDKTMCYQDSAQLGVAPRPGVIYSWEPSVGLSDANISNPKASPENSTIYTLTQTECDGVSQDIVSVNINHDCHTASRIMIPSAISDDRKFFIQGLEANSTLEFYDLNGQLVYSIHNYQNDFTPANLQQGMYIAILTRPNQEQIVAKVCRVQ